MKQIARPSDFKERLSELLPPNLLTLSNCFTEIAPDSWAVDGYNFDAHERVAEAAKFGIPADAVPRLVQLLSKEIGVQHSNAFPNLPVAQAFYRECIDKNEVALLGIGLDPSLLPSVYPQLKDEANRGYGLLERLELQKHLGSGGQPLGFEILGFEATKFHSWLCHDGPLVAFEKFGTKTNSAGFVASLDEATHISEWLKGTGAEPGIWEPWLVVKYAPQ